MESATMDTGDSASAAGSVDTERGSVTGEGADHKFELRDISVMFPEGLVGYHWPNCECEDYIACKAFLFPKLVDPPGGRAPPR